MASLGVTSTPLLSLLLTSVAAAFAISLVGTLIHRLLFHPLASFPGPKLAAATWWYTSYYEVFKDGALVEHLQVLHARYGPVVRIGPNQLHFNNIRAYNDIYTNANRFTKDPRTYGALRQDTCSFCLIDLRESKARRDILSPLFSRRAILKLEHVVQAKVNTLIHELLRYAETGKPANIRRGIRSVTLEVIYAYCFASEEDYITFPDFSHKFLLDSEVSFPFFHILVHFPWVFDIIIWQTRIAAWFKPKTTGVFRDAADRLKEKIDELVARPELLEKEEHETIFHHLLTPQARLGKGTGKTEVLPKKVLWEEAINLISAGSETTATVLSVGVFYILHEPSVYEKLINELKKAWVDIETVVHLETLEKLPYLTAVLKESMRIAHGVVNPSPRIVSTNASIAGYVIPAGTVVAVGATFIHLNPEIFPDPHAFKPERWLGDDKADLEQHLVAFSRGPRNCLGMNLAWCEMYLIMGYLFRKLKLELYNTTIEDMAYRCHLTPTFRGRMPYCKVTPLIE